MPRIDKSKVRNPSKKEMRLIELIRENPELYDSGHLLYKDNKKKKIIWECISEEMNIPVETVKRMWKKLRSNYMKKCREFEADKMTKSTPCDEALAFLMTSVMEYGNENNCGNSNVNLSSELTTISEEEQRSLPEKTLNPDNSIPSISNSAMNSEPRENFDEVKKKSDRILRPRYSEPSKLASKENLKMTVDTVPRRSSATPTTPSTRSRNKKSILDPNDSTKIFFDSMGITVSTFPKYLQAIVKLKICKIVSETECDLSSPKI